MKRSFFASKADIQGKDIIEIPVNHAQSCSLTSSGGCFSFSKRKQFQWGKKLPLQGKLFIPCKRPSFFRKMLYFLYSDLKKKGKVV